MLHGIQKKIQGQTKVFLGFKGHNKAGTIEHFFKSYPVWSNEGSNFVKKKDRILAKIPVLGNRTHISFVFDLTVPPSDHQIFIKGLKTFIKCEAFVKCLRHLSNLPIAYHCPYF